MYHLNFSAQNDQIAAVGPFHFNSFHVSLHFKNETFLVFSNIVLLHEVIN